MSTKGKKGGNKSKPGFRFINYRLSKEDREWLHEADLELEFPRALADEWVMEGYKFSASFDDKNSTCVCSITDRVEGGAFENCCLTGRGATPIDAWYALAYRHLVVAQGDWSVFDSPEDNGPRRFD